MLFCFAWRQVCWILVKPFLEVATLRSGSVKSWRVTSPSSQVCDRMAYGGGLAIKSSSRKVVVLMSLMAMA
jgi:hypothetical protein